MNDQIYKYEIEIEDDSIEYDRGYGIEGYGATIYGDVTYKLERVIDADTPLGPKYGQKVVIHEIGDATMFVNDRDGGELCDVETDLLEHLTEKQIIEEIEKHLERGA